jgi:colanic acid biosynthesis glycosyl transferase WcaI
MASAERRPRIVVLTQYYFPETGFITRDVAERLAESADVVVITTQPNFPLGRFFPGTFSWLPRRTVESNGVVVWRLPIVPDHSTSKLRRMVSYLSFALGAGIVAPFVGGRADTVWIYQTPPTTALAGLWFRVVMGSRIVFTVADLWPESLLAASLISAGPASRALFAFRRFTNRLAHRVICSTQTTLERFASEGVVRTRMRFVPVWVEGIPDPLPLHAEEGAEPRIVYVGNLGPVQELAAAVKAAAILERAGTPIRFEIYGSGTEESALHDLARSLKTSTVHFGGRVAPDDAFRLTAGATAQLISLRATPLLAGTIPSKLVFGLAAGSPMLAGLPGESGEIAKASGCALMFDPQQPETLAEAVRHLLSTTPEDRLRMREAARRTYATLFERQRSLRAYEEELLFSRDPTATSYAEVDQGDRTAVDHASALSESSNQTRRRT